MGDLAGLTRDTKYDYSLEKVVGLVNKFCTFPAVEKTVLFKLVLFGYLTGNDDMHLKNFLYFGNNWGMQFGFTGLRYEPTTDKNQEKFATSHIFSPNFPQL